VKSTVEHLSPTRVRINVEVPFDELRPSFDRAYGKLASQVRIPGFRPGKVPARILEARIGRGAVLEQVVADVIPAKYAEAVQSGEVKPVGPPNFEVTKIDDGQLLAFSAEVEVRPEIEVPAFESIEVSVDDVEVTDDEVGQQLESLRARFGTLKGVDRPVADKDFVVIDLSATVDGEDVPEAGTKGLSYEVGSGELVEGIDDALLGAAAGESRTFTTTLVAGEHAGKPAEVTVTVESVRERELPAADDEFAQLASEFDTLDELRGDLRERLVRVRQMQQGVQARDRVLDALLDATEVPLPQGVVDSEVDGRKHDAAHAFDDDDAQLDAWLQAQGQTMEQFDEDLRSGAEKAVKAQLVLDAIADRDGIQVSENELTDRILYQAQRFGVSPEEYLQRTQEAGQLGAIFAEVRRGKAIAEVLRKAAVADASGNRVDIEKLFAPAQAPSQDAQEPVAAAQSTSELAQSTSE
jgi:trigger factor